MYNSFSELIRITREQKIPIWKAVIREEAELSGVSGEEIFAAFTRRFEIMERSAKKALSAPQPTVADLRRSHCRVVRYTAGGAYLAER